MFDRVGLKKLAKEQISGKIGILFACTLVAFVIVAVSSFVAWLIAPAIAMGMTMIYLGISNNKEPKVGDVFNGFNIFGKAWWLSFIMGFFVMLWSMLLVIPGFIKMYAYSMAPFILADNPTMTAREALRESKRITNGAKMELFILELSFLGWAFLCGITFGLVAIYAVPYMATTYANVYQSLKAKAEISTEEPVQA